MDIIWLHLQITQISLREGFAEVPIKKQELTSRFSLQKGEKYCSFKANTCIKVKGGSNPAQGILNQESSVSCLKFLLKSALPVEFVPSDLSENYATHQNHEIFCRPAFDLTWSKVYFLLFTMFSVASTTMTMLMMVVPSDGNDQLPRTLHLVTK